MLHCRILSRQSRFSAESSSFFPSALKMAGEWRRGDACVLFSAGGELLVVACVKNLRFLPS